MVKSISHKDKCSIAGKFRQILIVCVLAGSVIFFFLPQNASISREILRTSGLLLFVVGFWATAALPEYLTALVFFLIAMISGIAPASVVFSGFHSTAMWLVFGGLVLGVAVKRTGLGQRIAQRLLNLFGNSYLGVISGVVFVAMLIGFFMPSGVARTVLLVPLVLSMAQRLGFAEGSHGRIGMVMGATLGSYAPSCAILPSNAPNMVLAGASESLYGIILSYGTYLKLHYPVLGIMKGFTIIILICILFPDKVRTTFDENNQISTPLSSHEWMLAFILSSTLILWLTDFLHGISPAWIALAAGLACLLPFTGIIPSSSLSQGINIGTLFYVAGVLGLGSVVAKTGLGEILSREILNLIGFERGHDLYNFTSLVLLSTGVSMVTTSPSLPAVITPMCADIASATGFPLITVLMTQTIGFSNLILPYQVAPVVVGMQLGGVSAAHSARLTLSLAAVSILFLLPANYLWWCLLGLFGNAPIGAP